MLDGTFRLYDANPSSAPDSAGTMSNSISDNDCTFENPVSLELYFTGIDKLTACCVFFSYGAEGWPTDYTVEILSSGTVMYTKSVEANTASSIMVTRTANRKPGCHPCHNHRVVLTGLSGAHH